MSLYWAVWGREPGPGPSFLRVSRWGTVWYWPFLCFTCSSHDKRVVCRETCLVLDAIRVTLPDWPGPINLLILLRCMS